MIEIFSKKAGLLVRDIFFATEVVPSNVKRDIDLYHECSSPILGAKSSLIYIVDLSYDKDILFSKLKHDTRRNVRRAIDTDGLVVDLDFTPTTKALESYKAFYNNFAAFKGLPMANADKLEALRRSGNFLVASVRRPNENYPLAIFTLISDGSSVYPYQASTIPRYGNDGQAIGRACRLLHWQMMLALKKAGVKNYNFGLIYSSENPKLQALNDFKREFGGIENEIFNVEHGVSWLGKLALHTRKLALETRNQGLNKSNLINFFNKGANT
jgi:hypothetical protein